MSYLSNDNNDHNIDQIRHRNADNRIVRIFPYLVVVCLITTLLYFVFSGGSTFTDFLITMCTAFGIGFICLGILSAARCDRSIFNPKICTLILILMPIILGFVLYYFGYYIYPNLLTSRLFVVTDNQLHDVMVLIMRLYILMVIAIFASHGVISVIVAYFRKYIARVYGSMEKLKNDGTDKNVGKFTLWMYKIPKIIDIHSVELEPVDYNDKLRINLLISASLNIFTLGLILCSYLFLNPIFINQMTFTEMIVIAMLLSVFIPVLVIPWYITKDTGAKVKSQARDYYLWIGMKKTLYRGFFTIAILVFLVAMLAFTGNDYERVILTYAGYIVFMGFMSFLFTFIYVNNYHKGLIDGIVNRYKEQ